MRQSILNADEAQLLHVLGQLRQKLWWDAFSALDLDDVERLVSLSAHDAVVGPSRLSERFDLGLHVRVDFRNIVADKFQYLINESASLLLIFVAEFIPSQETLVFIESFTKLLNVSFINIHSLWKKFELCL